MEYSTWYAPKDMGGALPHKNNLIVTAAVGGSKPEPLKMNGKSFKLQSAFTCSLADEPEAGRAGQPPYHQAETWPSKRIWNFIKAVKLKRQAAQQGLPSHKETKTANRKRASPVTSRNGDISQRRFPGNMRKHWKRKLSRTQVIKQNLYSYWTDELIRMQKTAKSLPWSSSRKVTR